MSVEPLISQWPGRIARTAGWGVSFIGGLVLLGWAIHVDAITTVMPGLPAMSPATALGFLFAGISLLHLTGRAGGAHGEAVMRVPVTRRFWPLWCGAVGTMLLGLARLGGYATGRNFGLDQLWLADSPAAMAAQMSPPTALNFVLVGLALLLAGRRRYSWTMLACVFLVGLVSWFNLTRFLFGGEPLPPFALMAVNTTAGFLLLAMGILCARPDGGPVALLVSNTLGGMMARRLLAPALVASLSLEWLQLEGERAGWFGNESGLSLFALSFVVLFGSLVWAVAARLDRAIREREQAVALLAAIVDSSGDAIIGKDLNSIVTSWNRGAEKIFGYTAGEMIGTSIMQLICPDRQSEEAQILAEIRRGESVQNFETVRQARDGRRVDVSVTVSPIRDASGAIIGASKILRDITKKKQVETALRESETNYRTLFASASDGIFISDPRGRYLDVNDQGCQMLGYTRNEILALSITDIVTSDEAARLPAEKAKLQAGKVTRSEWQCRRKDGKTFPCEISATILPDGRILASRRDITERVQAGQRIRQLNRVYAVLSGINETIVREKEPTTIFAAACRIAVEKGDFRLAWIGRMEAAGGQLQIVAHAGANDDTLQLLHTLVGGERPNCSFTFHALQTGRRGVCNDIERDPQAAPWRVAALQRDYLAMASLPLRVDGATIGTFNLYASEPGFFDAEELRLLDELAMDISFAVEVARRENDRLQAEKNVVAQLTELQRWHDVMLNREDRIQTLKAEVNVLLTQQAQPPRYSNPTET